MSGDVGLPKNPEGEEIVRQFGALKKHRREQIYDLSGNHDRSGLDEPQAWWWRKWIDPAGEHTEFSQVDASKRPFPIDGTWERYSFRVGNLLFLMMSDINEPTHINVAGLTKYMCSPVGAAENCVPRSWLLTFTDNSAEVTAQCYLHTSDYAPQGWYPKFDRVIKLIRLSKPGLRDRLLLY